MNNISKNIGYIGKTVCSCCSCYTLTKNAKKHPHRAKMICNDTLGFIKINAEAEAGIGDAGEVGRRETTSNEEESICLY